MINTQRTQQGTCPCGDKFIKRGSGKYCNRCKDLRRSESGRKYYEELIK